MLLDFRLPPRRGRAGQRTYNVDRFLFALHGESPAEKLARRLQDAKRLSADHDSSRASSRSGGAAAVSPSGDIEFDWTSDE